MSKFIACEFHKGLVLLERDLAQRACGQLLKRPLDSFEIRSAYVVCDVMPISLTKKAKKAKTKRKA